MYPKINERTVNKVKFHLKEKNSTTNKSKKDLTKFILITLRASSGFSKMTPALLQTISNEPNFDLTSSNEPFEQN